MFIMIVSDRNFENLDDDDTAVAEDVEIHSEKNDNFKTYNVPTTIVIKMCLSPLILKIFGAQLLILFLL